MYSNEFAEAIGRVVGFYKALKTRTERADGREALVKEAILLRDTIGATEIADYEALSMLLPHLLAYAIVLEEGAAVVAPETVEALEA